jgi:hypothetical protein
MPNLSGLLRKLESLHRQQHDLAGEVADVERQIIGASGEPKPRTRSTKAETIALVREVVQVLRTAGQPLPRAEIAARLNQSPAAISYRLQKAIRMRFVERTEHGMYRVVVPVTAI